MFLQNVMAKTFLKPFLKVLKRFVLAGLSEVSLKGYWGTLDSRVIYKSHI